jgi:hypothetical protein
LIRKHSRISRYLFGLAVTCLYVDACLPDFGLPELGLRVAAVTAIVAMATGGRIDR